MIISITTERFETFSFSQNFDLKQLDAKVIFDDGSSILLAELIAKLLILLKDNP